MIRNYVISGDTINNALNEIKISSNEHNLKLSYDKLKVMYFGNKRNKTL